MSILRIIHEEEKMEQNVFSVWNVSKIVQKKHFKDNPTNRKRRRQIMNKKAASAIILTASSISAMHIMNRIHASLSTVKNLLSNSENQYYEWRFGKIRYQKKGRGTNVTKLRLIRNKTISKRLEKLFLRPFLHITGNTNRQICICLKNI